MSRRFPQKVRVGDLIGLPVLDDDDVTLGRVEHVVRTPEGKVKLIVGFSNWFGWFGRPVAVPIEVVAILGRQIASLNMPPAEYAAAPTWSQGKDVSIPGRRHHPHRDHATVRVACRHSGARASANPESSLFCAVGWISGSVLRTAPE